jgi:hypothetical protein
MERCHLCRRWINEQEVCRRLLPVSQSHGVTLSAVPGVSFFVHTALVSLCSACDAAIAAQQRPGLGGWAILCVFGILTLALVEWLCAAIVDGIWMAWQKGDYKVVAFLLGLAGVCGARLARRVRASRFRINPAVEVVESPPLQRRERQPIN